MVYTTHPWRPLVTKVVLKIELQLAILTRSTRYSHQRGRIYSHQWYKVMLIASWASRLSGRLGSAVNRFGPFGGFTNQCLVKQGHVCFSTYVVEDGLCNAVEKQSSAYAAGKQH